MAKRAAIRKTGSKKTGSKKTGSKKTASRKSAAKRELIDTGTDKRFVRRTEGRFKESDDVGKSLTVDRRTKAKTKVKGGQGDKGDH